MKVYDATITEHAEANTAAQRSILLRLPIDLLMEFVSYHLKILPALLTSGRQVIDRIRRRSDVVRRIITEEAGRYWDPHLDRVPSLYDMISVIK